MAVNLSTLHEITPEISVWGCPRCDTVALTFHKGLVTIQCGKNGNGCGFQWVITDATLLKAAKTWNQIILNQTKDLPKTLDK